MTICGIQGRAFTDPFAPEPPGICDRCNYKWMHRDLTWQYEWGGNRLINLKLLVCPRCLDVPNETLRSLVLPPDPVPVKDPRPGFYAQEEQDPVGGYPSEQSLIMD